MGTNIIFAIGALLIFRIFLSSSVQLMIGNTQIAEQNEYYISAIGLGQAVIDEAKTKVFDSVTDTSIVSVASSLTTPAKLGRETAAEKSIPKPDTLITTSPYSAASPGFRSTYLFNDVDDYDMYRRKINTQRAEGYQVDVKVVYVVENDPNTAHMSGQTFCKRMTVTVTSPFLSDPVILYYVFSY